MSNHDIKISIKGKEWTIRYLTAAQYKKKIGTDSGAITLLDKKMIVFNKANVEPGYIRHELLHALVEESSVESAMLSPAQIEEVMCSIVQHQWHNIAIWTDLILTSLFNKDELV